MYVFWQLINSVNTSQKPTILEIIELSIRVTVINKLQSLLLVKFQKDKETDNFSLI